MVFRQTGPVCMPLLHAATACGYCAQVLAEEVSEGVYDGIIHAGDYAYDFAVDRKRGGTINQAWG